MNSNIKESIKETMETMLPDTWEYCHDMYVEDAIEDVEIESMIKEGYSLEDIAQEVIDMCIDMENTAFKNAMEDIFNAEGVTFDEDGARASDELYTDEHRQEIEAEREVAEAEADDYREEVEYMWYHR